MRVRRVVGESERSRLNRAILASREVLRRRKARTNLQDFILYINPDYVVSDFSRDVCAALDKFLLDMKAEKRPILVIGAPPQHGKSDIVSRYFPAYVFGHFQDFRLGGLSYSFDLASNMNRDVQRIIMSPEYKALFPETRLSERRVVSVEAEAKRNSEEFEIVGRKGGYVGAGVGGALTGKKLDLGIIDDPIKNSKEALSATIKKGIWDWYVSTFLTRLSRYSGQIIMATRWATDDLSGSVIAKNKGNDRVTVLAFPAIDAKGNALVPELHPLDKLLETKETLGDYFWSAMYQQSPKMLGGNVFADKGIRYYSPNDLPKRFDRIIQSWDMTFKDLDTSDFVVGQVWGKFEANSYLIDQVRERLSFTNTLKAVEAMTAKHPEAREKLIEDKANGTAVIDSLKSKISGILPIEPDGSKVARAFAMTGEWEAGNIWIPMPEVAPWVDDFVTNVTTFPACAHDDEIDAMTQAIRFLYKPRRGSSIFKKR